MNRNQHKPMVHFLQSITNDSAKVRVIEKKLEQK